MKTTVQGISPFTNLALVDMLTGYMELYPGASILLSVPRNFPQEITNDLFKHLSLLRGHENQAHRATNLIIQRSSESSDAKTLFRDYERLAHRRANETGASLFLSAVLKDRVTDLQCKEQELKREVLEEYWPLAEALVLRMVFHPKHKQRVQQVISVCMT